MSEVRTYEDGIACAFDLLKVAACNTDDGRRAEILEEAAEDIIEYAPSYKRNWKDLGEALSQLAALREGLAKVSGERDRLRNGVESDMAEIDRIQSVYDAKFVQCRKLRVSLADAERRNAELVALLECVNDTGQLTRAEHEELEADICTAVTAFWSRRTAINKPEEAKS